MCSHVHATNDNTSKSYINEDMRLSKKVVGSYSNQCAFPNHVDVIFRYTCKVDTLYPSTHRHGGCAVCYSGWPGQRHATIDNTGHSESAPGVKLILAGTGK